MKKNDMGFLFLSAILVILILFVLWNGEFTITGNAILNLNITDSSQKISNTTGNFLEPLDNVDEFGQSVTSIGDLDGDNITDIAVGTRRDGDGGVSRGAVYILFLNTNGTVKDSQKISDTEGNFLETLDNGDFFGSSVTSIGDLDGDNITDIVVGAIADDDGGPVDSDRGAVYILFLNTNGTVKSSQKISNTTGNFLEPLDSLDWFGTSVTSIGDLDGDNITDIAIGAESDGDGGAANGAVYILFLNTNGTVKSSQKISATEGNFIETLDGADRFGSSVTSIGDLDGDNITDIVVGARQDDDGVADSGAVYILFLNTNGTVKDSQKISDTEGNFLETLDSIDYFGSSVTSIGDLDGDNITDIVVGAENDDDGAGDSGAGYILFLNINGSVKDSQKISDTEGNFLETLEGSDRFGISVTSIGDLNKDNIGDIAIGSPGDDDGGSARGAVYIIFLDDLINPLTILNSPQNNSNVSSPIIFNSTSTDNSNLTLVSLIINGEYNETNSSGINNSNYIFTKNLSEGINNWTYEACDNSNNCLNASSSFLTVDNTPPTANGSCNPLSVTQGGIITCTCIGSDSGTGINSITSNSTPSTSQAGNFIYNCSVIDYAGNSEYSIANYTIISSDPEEGNGDGGGGSSGGGGGGGISEPKIKDNELNLENLQSIKTSSVIVNLDPGKENVVIGLEEVGINKIKVKVNKESINASFEISKYDLKPSEISRDISGIAYTYLKIEVENINESLESATIEFNVEKSWLEKNNLSTNDIFIFKFNETSNNWEELKTEYLSEENRNYIYSIELNSFSFFTIAEKIREPTKLNEKAFWNLGSEFSNQWTIFLMWGFLVILLIIIIVRLLPKKKRKKRKK